ncbi:SDR family NAD(P)-dependent oxidoreductase [Streptomyces sp. NPDC050759]|uniref:SDR family NAD(P)-dependent oxidoreductase n=1 Tax=Streptomyces sp. NPDC050759 TaxID=3365635 RepID=UPI003799C2D4
MVTGASGDIGRGSALRFAQEGASVALDCRTAVAAAREVTSRIEASGARAVVPEADLRDEDEGRRLVVEAAQWGGGLTAPVNNAGVAIVTHARSAAPEYGTRAIRRGNRPADVVSARGLACVPIGKTASPGTE